jgi:hypothetical protein
MPLGPKSRGRFAVTGAHAAVRVNDDDVRLSGQVVLVAAEVQPVSAPFELFDGGLGEPTPTQLPSRRLLRSASSSASPSSTLLRTPSCR